MPPAWSWLSIGLVLFILSSAVLVDGRHIRIAREAANDEDEGSNNHESNGVSRRAHFGYSSTDDWTSDFSQCSGQRQSPINIDLQEVKKLDLRQPLGRSGYDYRPLEMTMANNGHTVKVDGVWQQGQVPTIYGGPLNGPYELDQLHFHWGPNNDVGSEHTVADHSYPLELHLVHWKKSYGTINEAIKHSDGIAVLGYLMSLDRNVNIGLERMRSGFSSILKPGQSTKIHPFPLTMFNLQPIEEGYITYVGSLTTPPCSESVIWLISVCTKNVTIDEMDSFRKLTLNNNDNHNYRPTQPLNGRSIHYFET